MNDGKSGDLYVTFFIEKHNEFLIEESNIRTYC